MKFSTTEENSKLVNRMKQGICRLRWKRIIAAVIIIAVLSGIRYVHVAYWRQQREELSYNIKVEFFGFKECSDMQKDKNPYHICKEHNAGILQKIDEWNQEGLRSFMDWDESVYTDIEKLIEENTIETEITKKNALLLMNGGADILNMDMEEFLRAVDFIEERAIMLDEYEEIFANGGIETQWQKAVGKWIYSTK